MKWKYINSILIPISVIGISYLIKLEDSTLQYSNGFGMGVILFLVIALLTNIIFTTKF